MNAPLYEVKGLNIAFKGRGGDIHAVRNVGFSLARERLGIVGESGSGKSTTGRALLGLLPHSATMSAEVLRFAGTDVHNFRDRDWQGVRGKRIGMVMQDPKYSLNPVVCVGQQIAETYRLHCRASHAAAKKRAIDMLDQVQIRDPDAVFQLYPHQLSGGMGQRVMIAAMLIAEPELLIADEPTSALDVTVQNQVLKIIDKLVRERGMGLIFITHNLTIVSSFCDRVLVMYGGKVLEECAADSLHSASHPYTRSLVRSAPVLGQKVDRLTVTSRDPAWLL